MQIPEHFMPFATGAAETLAAILLIWLGIRLVDRLLPEESGDDEHHNRFKRQVIKIGIAALGVIALLIVLPVSNETRGQLFSLLGIVVTAIIALSSTSFVSNAMAGVMLRSVGNFRPGDFIEVQEHFGRVTDRGLFHTEIQTETRDLTTLPNMFLVQHPVKVTHNTGTIVSANVSLGYDVPHETAKAKLVEATEQAELGDGYVRVAELLDHAVQYTVYGLLEDPKKVLSARSRLREEILNSLHSADIEIASPAHMYHRNLDEDTGVIPARVVESATAREEDNKEELIFDKAEEAEKTETLRQRRDQHKEQLDALKKEGGDKKAIKGLQGKIEHLDEMLAQRAEQQKEER